MLLKRLFQYFACMDIKQIGDTIKKFRELKNISRETMAAEIDMSLSGYGKVERGEIDLTLSRIQKIAEVLKVDLQQVLNFDATQVFNITNNKSVQGVNNTHIHSDEYRDKYIQKLEEEIELFKKQNKNK